MAYPNDTGRLDWHFTNGVGANCHVVQHFKRTSGASLTTADCVGMTYNALQWWDVVGGIGAGIPALKSQANLSVTLLEVTATGLAPLTPPQDIRPINIAGSQAGNALPPEVALVISLKTGIVGKSYRGRSFWPGLDPDQLEANGTLSAAALTAYQNQWTGIVNALNAGGTYSLAVNSPTLGLSSPVTSVVVRDTPHHQRRRNS